MRRGQPRHWTYREEKARRAIFVRDNYECQIRGPMCLGIATEIDHIHPKVLGGRAMPENLRAACRPCNRSKGPRAAQPEPYVARKLRELAYNVPKYRITEVTEDAA